MSELPREVEEERAANLDAIQEVARYLASVPELDSKTEQAWYRVVRLLSEATQRAELAEEAVKAADALADAVAACRSGQDEYDRLSDAHDAYLDSRTRIEQSRKEGD